MSLARSRLRLSRNLEHGRVVEVQGAPNPVRDWLYPMTWRDLRLLAQCTARQVGSGHELAGTMYDDDADAADKPFVGVQLIASFRDGESTVFSREEYDAIVADVCDIAIANPPDPLPEWWDAFLANAEIIRGRADG